MGDANTEVAAPVSGRSRWVGVVFVLLLSLCAYANTLSSRYAWDDVSSFLFHEHVKDPAKFFQLFREDQHAFGRGQGNFYRPLVSVSFMLDHALSEPSTLNPAEPAPLVFHLSSAIWHALAALGLFALLRRMGASERVCLVVASVFAVHPLHTEAVAYVSGRADSMSAAFMFWALWLALSKAEPGPNRPNYIVLLPAIGSLFLYTLAQLSKESSSVYPALLAVCLWITAGPDARLLRSRRMTAMIGSLVLLTVYWILRSTVLNFGGGGGASAPLVQRLTETVQAFGRYLALMFYPVDLHMQRNTIEGATPITTAVGIALLTVCIFVAIALAVYRQRRAAGGLVWFLVAWFPISGIFTLNAPMAEHWMYVPMAGFWLALAELLPRADHPWPVLRDPRLLAPVGGVVAIWVLGLLGTTAHRNLDWRSSEAIFRSTLEHNPQSTMVHFNLGLVYEGPEDNMPGARRHYEEMMSVFDGWRAQGKHAGYREEEVEALFSLGNIAYINHDYQEAGLYYSRLVEEVGVTPSSQPILARAAFLLGKMHLESGNRQLALEYLRRAVEADPFLEPELASLGVRLQ